MRLLIVCLSFLGFTFLRHNPYGYTERSNGYHNSDFGLFNEKKEIIQVQNHVLMFEVKNLNIEKLKNILSDISDPFSPNYGNYLTRDDIHKLTGNTRGLITLRTFFKANDVEIISESLYGEFITAKATVSCWEQILTTEFFKFQHKSNKKHTVLRALQYTIPDSIAPFVGAIYKAIDFPLPQSLIQPKVTVKPLNTQTIYTVTPSLLNSYYNIFTNTGSLDVSQTIYSALDQYWSPDDLSQFQRDNNIPQKTLNGDPQRRNSTSNCKNNPEQCAESNLDLQYLVSIAQNTYTTITYDVLDDPFISWITGVANTAKPSQVYSISYGCAESYITSSIMTAFNIQAMKLGVMGTTIVVATGDNGAPSAKNINNEIVCKYNPIFPASSPYVVAVGATMGPEAGRMERGCDYMRGGIITSGGGFSSLATRLSHQDRAINKYFATLTKTTMEGYSTTGRGYPDVSLMGKYYETVIGGQTYLLSGTSASAPVFAAMVSLVNAARLKIGKSTVGFLNPALYAYNGSFVNDITAGNNKCTTDNVCCPQGFYASAGWDPVTGLGSVDFTKFYNLFATTSAPSSSPTSRAPSRRPTNRPTLSPTKLPSKVPTLLPSAPPSSPSSLPSSFPSRKPTLRPTIQPSRPTVSPSSAPSRRPSGRPTVRPSQPTSQPSFRPTRTPTSGPSRNPSSQPTVQPTAPSFRPSATPTVTPTLRPTRPTSQPTFRPSSLPTRAPSTSLPTRIPSTTPTTSLPTRIPSTTPSSSAPTRIPSTTPSSLAPTRIPSTTPSSSAPTRIPSTTPSSSAPTRIPSTTPSSSLPTRIPSTTPSASPTTTRPTSFPTKIPSYLPSASPTSVPTTGTPTVSPTAAPSYVPTTRAPTSLPTTLPSDVPTTSTPTLSPSSFPTSKTPTLAPSALPSYRPSRRPATRRPTTQPTSIPSFLPTTSSPTTKLPTAIPTCSPTIVPTFKPVKKGPKFSTVMKQG